MPSDMMSASDLKNMLNELNRLTFSILKSLDENQIITVRQERSEIMGMKISTNISIKVGLAEALRGSRPNYLDAKDTEPLVDVFEDKQSLKIIALLPGIKKENADFKIKKGLIEILVKKDGKTYLKEIPCSVTPEKIYVKSTTYNNSVLEIVFRKGEVIDA